MSSIRAIFERTAGKGVLLTYLMGGDPDEQLCLQSIEAVVSGGADIVELGIPFSDPLADGKSIQEASSRALRAGIKPGDVLNLARDAGNDLGIPIVLMTYYNIVYRKGVGRFLDLARRSGVAGIIVPDLPVDEATDYCIQTRRRGMDAILLATPTTTPERMRRIVANTSGFLYLVSLLGVTGARDKLSKDTLNVIRYACDFSKGKVPLAVGFGISKPEHVRNIIAAGAEGAIVGSSIVNIISHYADQKEEMLRRLEAYVRSLKSAI
jgi:tryptophan synthase alpha chain